MEGKRVIVLYILLVFLLFHMECHAQAAVPLTGSGSKGDPYLIQSLEDLIWFRNTVNGGEGFAGVFFQQTENIDMAGMEWDPVGIFGYGNYFEGCYDGAGHYVANLSMNRTDNCAFFAGLAGTVMNFGIESGHIAGACAAGIAGHSQGLDAQVINCYNKADIKGTERAGGIVDNFAGNVCNCVNMGQLEAPVTGEVSSYNAARAVYCYGLSEHLYPVEFFSGWDYKCGAFILGIPETEQTVSQLNRNAYWLKQDVALSLGELCYWDYVDGKIVFAENDGYNDLKYSGKLLAVKIVCSICFVFSIVFIVLSIVKKSEKGGC